MRTTFFNRFVVVLLSLTKIHRTHQENLTVPGWFNWGNKIVASKFLLCPDICKVYTGQYRFNSPLDEQNKCCRYVARPIWSFTQNVVQRLEIEFTDVHGPAKIVTKEFITPSGFLEIIYHNSFLRSFPYNICKYNKTVLINFSNNMIAVIPDIKCLYVLDKLNLSNNRIEVISNKTFSNLLNLRDLDISGNGIKYIDPNSFSFLHGSLLFIRLSKNRLSSIDITNIILQRMFSDLDLSQNSIEKVTNEVNWTCCKENIRGGFINLSLNAFIYFPNLTEVGFQNAISMGKIVRDYFWDVHNCKWTCDCHFIPWMKPAFQYYDFYPEVHSLYNVSCSNPQHLKHMKLPDFRKDNGYDMLICNLTIAKKCPVSCDCFLQPSKSRTIINCSSKGFGTLPSSMPDFDNLEIDLSNNIIVSLNMRNYFRRATRIDLSGNKIIKVTIDFITLTKLVYINLLNNDLLYIDVSMHVLNPCMTLLGHVELTCDCNSMWMQPWLSKQIPRGCAVNSITCLTEKGKYNASSISRDDLCNSNTTLSQWKYVIPIIVIIIIILLGSGICYIFRYELRLLSKRVRSSNFVKSNTRRRYDVYISLDEAVNEVRRWVVTDLLLFLEGRGYKVFLPCRDLSLGCSTEEEIATVIGKCDSVIVILTQEYFQSSQTNIEFKYGWHGFRNGSCSKLLVINFDLVENESLKNRKMNALMRLGYSLDFADRDK